MTKRTNKTSSALLVTDDHYLDVLIPLLQHAEKSVELIAYSFAVGTSNRRAASAPHEILKMLSEIKERKKSKIKIRCYLEGRRETAIRNRETGTLLKKAGILVKYGSTHAKGFCVDGRYVLFGSTNLTNQSIRKNYETNLLVDDPRVTVGFEKYFEHLWGGGRHGEVKLTPPMYADGSFKPLLLRLIAKAKKRIEFSIYFFHHSEIEHALIAAHNRGVKITGLIHDHNTFALSYVRRTHGTADRLRAAGIKDLHYAPAHFFTHSKYLICDRKELALGTGNWLHEDVKVHPQLYIHLENAKIAVELAKDLARKIKN